MPDLDLIKQGEHGLRDGRGRFARGRSAERFIGLNASRLRLAARSKAPP
jgi:hypothetical protein